MTPISKLSDRIMLLSISISENVSGLISKTYSDSIESTIEMASEEIELEIDEDGKHHKRRHWKGIWTVCFLERICFRIASACLAEKVSLI